MQNEISKLYNLPDISFVDDISYEKILNEMIADYERSIRKQPAGRLRFALATKNISI